MKNLLELRDEIDVIDKQIVALYQQRMQIAGEVAEYKIETGKKVFDKDREMEKLATLSALGDSDVRRVLKVIYEKRLSADTASDNVCISDDELTRAAGLSADVVYAAAQKLVSVRLLDVQESIENGCHVMSYTTRQAEDLAYVMAILRLAYAFTEDAVYETRMLCRADGQTNRPR